jgi:hypothetical protein
LENAAEAITIALEKVITFFSSVKNRLELEASARDLTFALGKILVGALLYEQAAFAVQSKLSNADQDVIALTRWCDPADLHKDIPRRDDKKVLEGKHGPPKKMTMNFCYHNFCFHTLNLLYSTF